MLNIGAKAGSFEEKVHVWWADSEWNWTEFGVMTWDELKDLNEGQNSRDINDWDICIEEEGIYYVYVYMENTVLGSTKRARVNLTDPEFCNDDDGSATLLQTANQSKGKLPVRVDL